MEKRISFFEFQNAVSIAKLIDPYLEQLKKAFALDSKLQEEYTKLNEKITKNNDEIKTLYNSINAYESGIVKTTGLHVSDIVKKVTVPTGKLTPKGKEAVTTDYIAATNVSYDDTTKQYVVNVVESDTVDVKPDDATVAGNIETTAFKEYGTTEELPFENDEKKEEDIF